MKFLKYFIYGASFVFLVVVAFTENELAAIPLLMFSSASAGIKVGENIKK